MKMKLTIPVNRVVAWLGPPIAAIDSGLVSWLVAKENVLGLPGLDKANTATYVAAGVSYALTAGLHALGGWAWLKGHHIIMQGASDERVASIQAAGARVQHP
jgi:hypothetical protein